MPDQEWSDRHQGELQQSHAEYTLGSEGKQTNDTKRSGPRQSSSKHTGSKM